LFLTVVIPGNKISFPVAIVLIMPFMGIISFSDSLLILVSLTGVVYLVISYFTSIDTNKGKILTIICLLIFWSFLFFYTDNFIKYIEPKSFTTLLLFVLASAGCLFVTVRNLVRKSR
jgi:hypothetical protein